MIVVGTLSCSLYYFWHPACFDPNALSELVYSRASGVGLLLKCSVHRAKATLNARILQRIEVSCCVLLSLLLLSLLCGLVWL
jgi:hypothetical protein